VAIVEYAHPTHGKLFVKVQNGYEMDELHNVSAQSPTTGQTLVYNASTLLWEKSFAPIISGTTINGTVIGGTTPAVGTFTTLTSTGQANLGGVAGSESLIVNAIAGSTRWIEIAGSVSGNTSIRTRGAGNPSFQLVNRGTGPITFSTADTLSNIQAQVSNTASAVNYVQATGGTTNNRPTISSQGSDTDIGFNIVTKGSGTHNFASDANIATSQFQVTRTQASAVNYLTATGAATNFSPRLLVAGTDTNISQVFQSKGTGAIDLAAGSSGVNISNGGTVTAITRTNGGSTYTSTPTLTIAAPTTAGGVQATATFTMGLGVTPTVTAGGTGYTVGNTLTVVGGTGTAAVLTVSAVSAGAITAVTVSNFGTYSVLPSVPFSVTGGTGSSATFTSTFGVNSSFTITNAGSGYVEQPTVSFSGGGGSGAAAYATVGSGTTVKTLGSTLSFTTPSGEAFRVADGATTATVNYWTAFSSSSTPFLRGSGTAANGIDSSNTAPIVFRTNGSSFSQQFAVSHTASAVNYVQVTGAATGGRPTISAQGSDASAGLNIYGKAGGSMIFSCNGGSVLALLLSNTTSGVNYYQMAAGVTGTGPVLSSQGSDTNIPLVLQPKGTGALQAQQTDSTATGGNARGANAVDWQTFTRSSAAQVASGLASSILGGARNTSSSIASVVVGGTDNTASANSSFIGAGNGNIASGTSGGIVSGINNTNSGIFAFIGAGQANTNAGYLGVVVGGAVNSGTSGSAVTTQSGTMNGTTAVTLSGSNANIKVGQLIQGTSIVSASGITPYTYVAAISGTSLTLSQAASGSSTSTLSFYTPHGVVVGGGNNQATGSYSFIGGGGDAGTAANRNVASGDWSVVGGGRANVASGVGAVVVGGGYDGALGANTASGAVSFIGGGRANTASSFGSSVIGGYSNTSNGTGSSIYGGDYGTTRSINGITTTSASETPFGTYVTGQSQTSILVLGRQTTDATPTVLRSDPSSAGTTNQVILPNNSAYAFKGTVIANVTGAANGAAWSFEGAIMRGANAASTVLIGTPAINRVAATAGATAWVIALTADTTNGGLAVTVTGAASTTIRWVCRAETCEVTF
jgi:hypothetical protein